MGLTINLVTALLVSLAVTTAGLAPFPYGKTVVYKYYGDVKAGIIEPAAYASQFALQGTFYVEHVANDPEVKNTYNVALQNLTTGMHNGIAAHYQRTSTLKPIEEGAKAIEQPFVIQFDDNGRFKGVKIDPNEPGWSKNMKMAIASMLQLDLPNINVQQPMKPHSFISQESTIHGSCWINYDVHSKDPLDKSSNEIIVTKFTSPMNCTGFVVESFNQVDIERCQAQREEPVNAVSRRVFEIENQDGDVIIKKLVAAGGSNYFPWNTRSEAHYVLTNATFALDRIVPVSEISLGPMDFSDATMTRDLTYLKPASEYVLDAAVDVTQGRRVVKLDIVVAKVKQMLVDAVDYIENNNPEMKEPDWKRGQTINRLLREMSYMDAESMNDVFNTYKESTAPKDLAIKNIFLGLVPQVGSPASALFTLHLVYHQKTSVFTAIEMLHKLPLSIKDPTTPLLTEMDDLTRLRSSINIEVRKAGILCFSSLIYKTFKNLPRSLERQMLQRYIDDLFLLLQNDPVYEMKVTYLMAIRNIQLGEIYRILAPIIRGDVEISDKPTHIRLLAIWAINKAIEEDYDYAHDLLWPIMADSSLPVKLRIAAYDILIHQAPTMTSVYNIYWFMVYERNENFYNYHYTTMMSIANSVDPCKKNLRDLVRKRMRFMKNRSIVSSGLSNVLIFDYNDEDYNHAEKFHFGQIVNEFTGFPEVMHFEHVVTDARKPYSNMQVQVLVEGLTEIIDLWGFGGPYTRGKTPLEVLGVLMKAAEKLPIQKKIHIDIIVSYKGRVVLANHYNGTTVAEMIDAVWVHIGNFGHLNVSSQHVYYDNLYEKQVTSDMGLPVVFETRLPVVTSVRIDFEKKNGVSAMDLDFDAKIWRHGDYSISVYNPMSDVWHAIRKATATNINLPLKTRIIYDFRYGNAEFHYPQKPAVAGVVIHSKDFVTVDENDTESLKKACPSCNYIEDVTMGSDHKKEFSKKMDSKNNGLEFSMSIFDCENGITPTSLTSEWYRIFNSENKNDWNDLALRTFLTVRQQVKNMIISPRIGSCGLGFTIKPSKVYPTSRINLYIKTRATEHTMTTFDYLSTMEMKVWGTIDVIEAPTNTIARSWDYNFYVDINAGHTVTITNIHLTRRTPGEKNLKICIDWKKMYPVAPKDPLKLVNTNEKTNTNLTIAVEHGDNDECVGNDTLVTFVINGTMSDEQKKAFAQDKKNGACLKDMKNPLYASPKKIVPKTLNCLYETIRYTSLRKYSIEITHKKLPDEVISCIRHWQDITSYFSSNANYTVTNVQSGKLDIEVDFPMHKNVADFSIGVPRIGFEKPRFKGFGELAEFPWKFPLDNTRFTIGSLGQLLVENYKMCSVYPRIVLTADGQNIPFSVPTEWTLVAGDHANKNWAVFAKAVDSNLAIRVYKSRQQVDIIPNGNDTASVIVNGQLADVWTSSVVAPVAAGSYWYLKVVKFNDHIIVHIRGTKLVLAYSFSHVAFIMDKILRGEVSGLCGHLDGSHINEISEFYTLPAF